MAGLRISQLPAATAVASADIFPFSSISGSQTRKVAASVLGLALTQLGLSVGPTQPLAPYNGQPWIDTSTNPPTLKCWNGATWTILSFLASTAVVTNPGTTAPSSPILGQLWQDRSQTPNQLKVWDGTNWGRVDPLGITQSAADSRYLQLAGGTMQGPITFSASQTFPSPADSSITTSKLADGALAATTSGRAKMADLFVTTAKLSDSAVTSEKIADGTIVNADINSAAGIVDSKLTGTTCKAFVNFNGTGVVAIRASYNVSSITDNGTGDYTVNFTNALADANYFAAACAGDTSGGLGSIIGGAPFTTQTASALRLNVINGSASAAVDRTHVGVAIFR